MITFSNIAKITKGTIWSHSHYTDQISQWTIDSRKASMHAESIFVAFNGANHNGHNFISNLYQQGLRQFILSDESFLIPAMREDCNVLLVSNTLQALQITATYHRNSVPAEVWAITGSNGKTIVKEWLYQMLETSYSVLKSPKSYNSQIGVPLSVLLLTPHHELALFEAGISQKGEMSVLENILTPNAGIYTNIGKAHDEGFSDRVQKVKEKWVLFKHAKKVIYCKDHTLIDQHKPEYIQSTLTWGHHSEADIKIINKKTVSGTTTITLQLHHKPLTIKIPFTDSASIENAMHCITLMLYKNFADTLINQRLAALKNIPMRLQLIHGVNGNYLIDDTYNNDLSGLEMALEFLQLQSFSDKKHLILSDILQTGLSQKELYAEVASLIKSKGNIRVTGIGEAISKAKDLFPENSTFFPDVDTYLQEKPEKQLYNEVILIKGARPYSFEKIVQKLSKKTHSTVLEINLDALVHNLNYYRKQLSSSTKLLVMVKALAYGSGNQEVANLLQHHRVDYLGVAIPDEGVHLRRNGITLPIMVLNADVATFDNIIEYNLEPEMFGVQQLKAFAQITASTGNKAKIHLKLDTGMHRLGFESSEIPMLIELLKDYPHLEVASIFTHLAGADDATHDDYSHAQVAKFRKMAQEIQTSLRIQPILHVLNSAGILRFPQYQMNMVRLGIGLYGYESNEMFEQELKPISTLKTTISQIRHLQSGETVGYSRKGKVNKDSTIATIVIGYADGYSRAFGNGIGKVLVKGKLAPVIGNICMDMTMIDITGIEAEEGDEVIIFGETPTIKSLANSIGTIPYEILTNVSERVNRIYFSE